MNIASDAGDWVRSLVRLRTGVVLDPSRDDLIELRLGSLARARGMDSARELIEHARGTGDFPLRQELAEAMMTGETYFFRDGWPFELLRHDILPVLQSSRQDAKHLAIWSAACSTGQELVSVALLLRETFPNLLAWDLRLLGTDVSSIHIDKARQGIYSPLEVSRGLPPNLLHQYFLPHPDGWRVSEPIRRSVTFEQLNLFDPWPAQEQFDVILLRNVLIYFDPSTRSALLYRLARTLRPDGYLILGGGETTLKEDAGWERVDAHGGCYYRPAKKNRPKFEPLRS